MILNITVAMNTNNKGLEHIFRIFEKYSLQYLVSDTNIDIESIIIKNVDTYSPPIFITSEGYTEFDIILIQTSSKAIFQITLYS